MDVSLSETIDQNTYLKKFRGGFSPLAPLSPPMHIYLRRDFASLGATGQLVPKSRCC